MTIALDAWHVLLALVAAGGWVYVQWLRPVQVWRRETEIRVVKIEGKLEAGEKRFEEHGKKDDEMLAEVRGFRADINRVNERLASIETLLKERGGVPPDTGG